MITSISTQIANIITQLKTNIENHAGMYELKKFGRILRQKPLNFEELKIFMATLWAFYRETPNGILSLSLKVGDFWNNIDPWEATAKAAHLLYADVDEVGLYNLRKGMQKTHHQLFKISAKHFGISVNELLADKYCLPAGIKMGKACYEYYRNQSIPVGLGFHLASELTSWPEFKYFYRGIITHLDAYKFKDKNDEALLLFKIHTLVEPIHLENSEKIVAYYYSVRSECLQELEHGTKIYMDCYYELFKELNSKIN